MSNSEVNNKRGLMSLDTPESSEGGSIDNNEYAAGDNEGGRRPGSKRMKKDVGQHSAQRDAADDDAPGSDDDSSSDEDEDGNGEDDSDVDVVGGPGNGVAPADREIQVEFEARSPQECDFYGLVHLLKQMLRPASSGSHINVSDLADRIISQRAVGSVITQSPDDADDSDDEDDGVENAGVVANGGGGGNGAAADAAAAAGAAVAANGNGAAAAGNANGATNNEVFGVGTVLKLVHGSSDAVGDQIVSHLLVNTAKSPRAGELRSFLQRSSSSGGSGERVNLGFLISERILNMPPQISVPMYETLQKELRKAVAKNLPFDFTHFVMISRQFVAPDGDDRNVIFTNAEEEVFIPECDLVLEMESPAGTSQETNGGSNSASSSRTFNSSFTSDEYVEKRKLLVFKANKLEKITNLVKGAFPIN